MLTACQALGLPARRDRVESFEGTSLLDLS